MQNLMPPVDTPDNLFHDGDPSNGIEGTIVTAKFLNDDQSAIRDMQAEIISVLTAAGIEPDPATQTQLLEAIQSMVGAATPDNPVTSVNGQTGAVELSAGDVGALPADGTAAAATKLATARNIAGVSFDGTADIAINAGNVGAFPITGGELTGPLSATGNVTATQGVYESGGAVRVYSPNNPPPAPPGNGITGFRMANYGVTGGDLRDSANTIMTGIYETNGYDNPTTHEHRQAQFEVAGAWYNVAYV